jgi:peptidoglycan/LPS O-acetylase OafA/YrhL
VSEALQRFGFDPLLAALFLAFAMGIAAALVFLCDGIGGRLAQAVQPSSSKLPALEGLRGILALAVVAHHACCWYFFTQFGVWSTGRSVIFDRLASFGVMQFFYLSGFLFWRKLMRRGPIPAGKFYLSRFIRIAPVYYISLCAALMIGFASTGFKPQVDAASLIASLLQWILFSLGGQPTVNHADIARITSGVTWTLALEWLFYLSLPFLAWFARKRWRLALYALAFGLLFLLARYTRTSRASAAGLFMAASVAAQYAKFMLIGFGGGILIAAFESNLTTWLRPVWRVRNWIVVALFVGYLAIPRLPDAGQVLLLIGFALIVSGADLFGLLVQRSTRLLGAISYPIYLLHGLVYYAAMRLRGGIHSVVLSAYIAETALCLVTLLLLAALVHIALEQPAMRLSEGMTPATAGAQDVTR